MNVLRRPSVTRGSLGVSPTGTAEPNPTAPAGRIKPRINNGESRAPLAEDKTIVLTGTQMDSPS